MSNEVMELSKQALQSSKEQEKALELALMHSREAKRLLEGVLGVSEKPKVKRKRRTKEEMAAAKDQEQAEPAWQ